MSNKQGGVSWNTSHHKKRGVDAEFACVCCKRKYKMQWARDNHQKLCCDRVKEAGK